MVFRSGVLLILLIFRKKFDKQLLPFRLVFDDVLRRSLINRL